MANIKQLINEKFGYTTNLPDLSKMHADVQDREKATEVKKADHPLEKYRNEIRALMGSMGPDEMIERMIDFAKMESLGKKYDLAPQYFESLAIMQAELKLAKTKQDRNKINDEWEKIKSTVPYWFFGMLGSAAKDRKMETTDENDVKQLLQWMDEFNKEGKKEHEAMAKGSPDGKQKSQAEKNLDKAKK